MPMQSGLPLSQSAPWSNTIPDAVNTLFTQWSLDENASLMSDPTPDCKWADQGTSLKPGVTRVTHIHTLPQSGELTPFNGTRDYNRLSAVAKSVDPAPESLNFECPMVWLPGDNGWRLAAVTTNGAVIDLLGEGGAGLSVITDAYVMSGRVRKAKHVANLFFSSMHCAAHGLTAPTKFTYATPTNPNGHALFSDGTGADGAPGAPHHVNPAFAGSARFANVFPAYGEFSVNFGRSVAEMTRIPNAIFPSVRASQFVTDVYGPTHMLNKFWVHMISTLSPQVFSDITGIAAAAVTNAYGREAQLAAAGISPETFLGQAFGTRRYWIAPQLDDHPYCLENAGKDMWVNVSVSGEKDKRKALTWAKGAANNETCTPTMLFYGPGDPRAQGERKARWEGDLDIGFEPGSPNRIQVFFEA